MTSPDDAEPLDEPTLERIAAMHDALTQFLRTQFPTANALHVLAAVTYEVARIVGTMTEGLDDAEVDGMLDHVRGVMRDHLDAYRHHGLKT